MTPETRSEDTDTGELFFGVDARHVRQLGQQLVGDRVTAVSELVKNAYDADASRVTIDFYNPIPTDATQDGDGNRSTDRGRSSPARLVIVDDGTGMQLSEMESGWMRISTDYKERLMLSRDLLRKRAGRKGIGRFAAQTLGSHLRLRTSIVGESRALVVLFDWDNDYVAGKELATIANRWRYEPATEEEHGTTLTIDGLYVPWSQGDIERIAKSVLLLQPPFPVVIPPPEDAEAPDSVRSVRPERSDVPKGDSNLEPISSQAPRDDRFDVLFRVDNLLVETPSVEAFIDSATASVLGEVDADGRASIYVHSPRFGVDEVIALPGTFQATGAFTFRAAYYIYRADTLGSFAVKQAQQMGQTYGGMRVYRDGLRVLPYGEFGNDWLGLDLEYRRRTTLVPIGRASVFGQVMLTRASNPTLEDTASREGFIVNEAFTQLRRVLLEALVRTAVVIGTARAKKTTVSDLRAPIPTRVALMEQVAQGVDRVLRGVQPSAEAHSWPSLSSDVAAAVSDALLALTTAASEADSDEQTRIESLLGEVAMLRVLASLGTAMAVFSHEVRGALNAATTALAVASNNYVDAGFPVSDLYDGSTSIAKLRAISTYIDGYVGHTKERTRADQPLFVVLKHFAEKFVPSFSANVHIDWKVSPSSLRTGPMTRAELDSVLINFFTNAVKAMDGEGSERRISITCVAESDSVCLRFEDSGSGVDPAVLNSLFEPFVSASLSERSELGVGTGLGLKIVADIAEEYGGSVQLDEPSSAGYKTCFAFRIPRSKSQSR